MVFHSKPSTYSHDKKNTQLQLRQTKHTFHINNKKGNIPKQILAEAKMLPLLGDTRYL